MVSKEQNEVPTSSEPSKAKPTKAERRALQEAQRAAKGLDMISAFLFIYFGSLAAIG